MIYNLNSLADYIHKSNIEKGFWDIPVEIVNLEKAFSDCLLTPDQKSSLAIVLDKYSQRNECELLALIHSEISEALEAHRKGLNDDKLPHRDGLEVELADALIRILDMAAGLNMDIEGAVREKLEYNKTREYKHGKRF